MGTENTAKELYWCVVLIAGNNYLNDKKEYFLCLQNCICLGVISDSKTTSA